MNTRGTQEYAGMTDMQAIELIEGVVDGTEVENVAAWQHLVDNGLCWKLQGFYGHTAVRLIEQGIILPKEVKAIADVKKGDRVLLRNGLEAVVKGSTRNHTTVVETFVPYHEVGSVYTTDIIWFFVPGRSNPVKIEHTAKQLAYRVELNKELEKWGMA